MYPPSVGMVYFFQTLPNPKTTGGSQNSFLIQPKYAAKTGVVCKYLFQHSWVLGIAVNIFIFKQSLDFFCLEIRYPILVWWIELTTTFDMIYYSNYWGWPKLGDSIWWEVIILITQMTGGLIELNLDWSLTL